MKKKEMIITIIIAVVIMAIGVALYYLTNSSKQNALPQQENSIEQEMSANENTYSKTVEAMIKKFEDNKDSYQKVEKDLMGETTEGGSVNGYFLNNELQAMEVTFYGETGKKIVNYYIEEDTVYIQTEDTYYQNPISVESEPKVKETVNKKQLVVNEKALEYMETSKTWTETEKIEEIKKDLEEYSKILK